MKEQYKHLSMFLKVALEIVFYFGLVATVVIPFLLYSYPEVIYRYFWFSLGNNSGRFIFTIILIELFGVSALVIVRQLILIFKSVNEDNPFIKTNVIRFERISISCFVVFVSFLLKSFFYFTLITLVLTIAFLIAGLAALVFSRLFNQAVEFKSENDLTI